jgi:rhodanese-related sulfurtransferase
LKPILVYCSGGDCEDSHMLAQKLWGVQFNNVYVYKDGFPDWQKRGGSIHTGSNP